MKINQIKKQHGYSTKEGNIFFYILLAVYSIIMFVLFFRQATEYQGIYYSDMKAYILEVQGLNSGYEFPYPLFFWITKIWTLILTPETAIAFSTTLLNSLSIILLKYYVNKEAKNYFQQHFYNWSIKWDAIITILVFSLFFVSMIYSRRGTSFFGFDYIYRCFGICTPNPFWNATYLAVRPLTIICFFEGMKVLQNYEHCFDWKQSIAFGGFLFLATITKPSFTFIAVPVWGIVLVYRVCKNRFHTFRNTIYLGCCFLPTGAALLYQFFGVFSGSNSIGEETGIGFEIGKAWHVYSNNIPLSIIMGLAFPIGILILNIRELKTNATFRMAWQMLLVGMLTFFCLYEKGFRFTHMNFSWGYMHGMFFVYVLSVFQMFKNTMEWKKDKRRILLIPEWVVYIFHFICGINYFIYVLQGNNSAWF